MKTSCTKRNDNEIIQCYRYFIKFSDFESALPRRVGAMSFAVHVLQMYILFNVKCYRQSLLCNKVGQQYVCNIVFKND